MNQNGNCNAGVVMDRHATPRSYIVQTEHGSTLRRDLVHNNKPPSDYEPLVEDETSFD